MRSKTYLLVVIVMTFALTSIAYSADEVLTPENLCGIWGGKFYFQAAGVHNNADGKLLITQNLNGAFYFINQVGRSVMRILDGQGEIVNNQLIMRDRIASHIKINMNEKKLLEGEGTALFGSKGDLVKFKKVRDLTDEEKKWTLEELAGLLK
jgi:hypothetical protein